MSANKVFHLISDLKPFKDKWRVQVKLIHSWIQNPPYADESLELVLADITVSSTASYIVLFTFCLSFFFNMYVSYRIVYCF